MKFSRKLVKKRVGFYPAFYLGNYMKRRYYG